MEHIVAYASYQLESDQAQILCTQNRFLSKRPTGFYSSRLLSNFSSYERPFVV